MSKKIKAFTLSIFVILFLYFGGSFVFWNIIFLLAPFNIVHLQTRMEEMSNDKLMRKINNYDPFSPVPMIAMEILVKRQEKSAIPVIEKMTKTIYPDRRKEAIWALNELRSKTGK